MHNDNDEGEEMLISGARKKQEQTIDLSNYNSPEVQQSFDEAQFEKMIINGFQAKEEDSSFLFSTTKPIRIRFSLWRLWLGVFDVSDSVETKLQKLNSYRQRYQEIQSKFKQSESKQQSGQRRGLRAQQSTHTKGENDSMWNNYFSLNQLKDEIKKDVDRTFQDHQLFQSLKIKNLLQSVLFAWSLKNQQISYRQGMNEVAGILIFAYFSEIQGLSKLKSESDTLKVAQQFYDISNAEADIFTLLEKILNDAGHMESFRPGSNPESGNKILKRIQKIQHEYLPIIDNQLYEHFQALQVEAQIFLLRWIRCIFTREFHLYDTFNLWDAILWEYSTQSEQGERQLFLIDAFVLAMMVYVRQFALENHDVSICLKRFLKYPPIEDLSPLIRTAFSIKNVLFSENPKLTLQTEMPIQQMIRSKPQAQQEPETEVESSKSEQIEKLDTSLKNDQLIEIKLPTSKVADLISLLESCNKLIIGSIDSEKLLAEIEVFSGYLKSQLSKQLAA